ncbi:MAG: ABC transporter permease, partial [Bacteroidota bacterium]
MPSPPRFFLRLFRWFCRPELRIPIEGDIVELYLERVREKGKKRADLHFMKDVLLLFRKDIIRPLDGTFKLNRYGMLKNDIKTSLRTMKREKLYTFVNGIGLLSGFVLAILILIYVRFEQSYEHYNPTSERVVRITMDYLDGETLIDQDCETYHNLGPMIKDEFPEVVEFARAFDFELSLEIDGKTFKEPTAYAVDPSFLKMLGHPLLLGDAANALEEPNHMVLTTSTAKKFFGTTDVIGKIIPNGNNSLKVVGVVADSPPNTHLKFNVLVSYSYMEDDIKKREDPWDSNDTFTYLELGSSDQYSLFQQHLKDLSNRLRELDHIPDERIVSEKILDIHLYSNKSYEPEQNGSATTVFLLLGVALLVILIAILNYINLSTAKALDRAKEVG